MKQIKAVIVGAGNRANIYSNVSIEFPERLKIVGIVDPDPVRTEIMRKKYDVPKEFCFETVDEFVKLDKFADAVINGTMDHIHVETSIPILKKGYDMLLEKPFATNEKELREIIEVANQYKRKVLICHVLRYSPFYAAIKNHILNGEIGDIISIEQCEHVSYHHMTTSYVRGKWRSEKLCHAPMLLAKSCHDLDIMMWMMSDTVPVSVASFGSDFQFTPDKKPEGAGTRCMEDCPYVNSCRFSAYSHYILQPERWHQYAWKCLEGEENITLDRKKESMKVDNPYGGCVWDYERDGNVDHQSVVVNFKNGAVGTFSMVGGAAEAERNIHIVGTHGEIKGTFEKSQYIIRTISPKADSAYEEKLYDLNVGGDMVGAFGGHGGGEEGLVIDFLNYLNDETPSVSCTEINDSAMSHLVVFRAEVSRKNGTIEKIVL